MAANMELRYHVINLKKSRIIIRDLTNQIVNHAPVLRIIAKVTRRPFTSKVRTSGMRLIPKYKEKVWFDMCMSLN